MKREDGSKRGSFANRIIVLCVTVSLIITAAVLWEYHRLDTVLPAGVLTALLGLWGGELLIIALRQVLGADVVRGNKCPEKGQNGDNFP